MSKLQDKLEQYIMYPTNQDILFDLGWEYEVIGQSAAAVGFYLKTCELGNDLDLHYESLLRISICFGKQGNRRWIQRSFLFRAISLAPKRPEAYYLLSKHYNEIGDWVESYTYAVMGDDIGTNIKGTRSYLTFQGKIGLKLLRAEGAFKTGLFDECKELYNEMKNDKRATPHFLELVEQTLKEKCDKYI
jgi:tetratricopeptide (TPR) repeat protein